MRGRVAAAIAVAALVAGVAPGALAYCRRSACGKHAGTRCVPAQVDDCGVPLRWPTRCVRYSLVAGDEGGLPLAQRLAIVERAAARWTSVDCGRGRRPAIEIRHSGSLTAGRREFDPAGGNANVILFAGDASALRGLGRTKLSYDVATGAVLDADIVLGAEPASADQLEDVVLHELGHFLGLSHSSDPTAVMFLGVEEGKARSELARDDVAAICAVYPPAAGAGCDRGAGDVLEPTADDVEQRHGDAAMILPFVALLLVAGAVTVTRRRRHRGRRSR